jgi:hypothetical protein
MNHCKYESNCREYTLYYCEEHYPTCTLFKERFAEELKKAREVSMREIFLNDVGLVARIKGN